MKIEKWPIQSFGKMVGLKPHSYTNDHVYTKELTSWNDCTKNSPDVTELALNYLPTIKLLGQDLKNERRSERWGGLLYRVLSDEKSI